MKIVTNAITETNNCPVIAYITGGDFGAHTRRGPGLACEKIYTPATPSWASLRRRFRHHR